NTCLALVAVRIFWFDPSAGWLLAVPIVGVLLAYRFYLSEREKRGQVVFLYESSRKLQAAEAIDDAVAKLLAQAREVFRAEVAEIVFFPTRERGATFRTRVGSEGSVEMLSPLMLNDDELRMLALCAERAPIILEASSAGEHAAFLRRWGLRDAMAVPLRGDN